jgi:hypothetical protein
MGEVLKQEARVLAGDRNQKNRASGRVRLDQTGGVGLSWGAVGAEGGPLPSDPLVKGVYFLSASQR